MQDVDPDEQVAFCFAGSFKLLDVVRLVGLSLDFLLNGRG
jgi:hypothetical protein